MPGYMGRYSWFRRASKNSEAELGHSDGKVAIVPTDEGTESSLSVQKPAAESDYLYELDKTSQEILNVIMEWQKDHIGEGGGELAVAEGTIKLPATPVSLPQLQRVRRQFLSLNRLHSLPKARVRSSFIEYLNGNLG